MQGWRFFQKPVGLELYFLKPELTFTFFFFIFFLFNEMFFDRISFFGVVFLKKAIKHPQAPEQKIIGALAEIIFL